MPLINMRWNCCLPLLWHSMSRSHVWQIKIIEKWERKCKVRNALLISLLYPQSAFLYSWSYSTSSVQQASPKPISSLAGKPSLPSSSFHASLSHIVTCQCHVTCPGLPHDTRIWPQGLHERGQQSWREGQCWHNFTINMQCCLFVIFGWC